MIELNLLISGYDFVRIFQISFNSKSINFNWSLPTFKEFLFFQSSYSLSDITLQQYDIYGKIITVKLQYVLYKERVGIRPGQISRLVEGHFTKYGMPIEHAAQSTPLLKLGSLKAEELASFVNCVEDILFHCPARRESAVMYKQDEVQVRYIYAALNKSASTF